jgi:chromosomal replication initiator protein DnaA
MSLSKWELNHIPSEKDPNRWLLKLKIEENELLHLANSIPGTIGRPFLLENDECVFGIYIYEANDKDITALNETLKQKCPQGKITPQAKEEQFNSLIDNIAKSVDAVVPVAPGQKPQQAEPVKNVPPPAPPAPAAPAAPQRLNVPPDIVYSGSDGNAGFLDLELNPKYTFEDFIIGPNNRFTSAAAQAVADNPGKIYNPFFIYGGVGLGKTHMMHAVGHYVRKKTSLRILYVTTEKFMTEVIDSIRRGALEQMREHYRQVDLLLVDDIQFLEESESTQEEFFHTFNVLHQSGKQIIITSDRPPKHLTTLEDRLRSRFEWGLIADIKSPNLETRVAILKKKGEHDKLKLDDNILLYIASKLKSNIRELEGFLKRINAYASLINQEVNMELVHNLMADLLPAEEMEEAHQPKAEAAPPQQAAVEPPALQEQKLPAPPEIPQSQEPATQVPAPKPPAPQEPVVQPVHDEPKPFVPTQTKKIEEPEAPPPPPPPPPVKAPPPKPAAPKPVINNSEPSDPSQKSVDVAFFFPEGKDEELKKVKEHFTDVIKKHKLKFTLESIFENAYVCTGKINYGIFAELCKSNNVGIAIVLGPPMETPVEAEDFGNMLSTVMDDDKLSLQLIPWAELNKDYRYLNLALDITLLKHKM